VTTSRTSGSAAGSGAVSAPLRHALREAAARSSRILAETAGKSSDEIQSQLEAILDLVPDMSAGYDTQSVEDARWNVPRRYVDVLRSEFLAILAAQPYQPDGRDTVCVLTALEEVVRRSERTVTGRFVARLAGAESVNAVVEIAHDIRSPLSSILFLVDTIRRGQSGKVSPIQERQLGLVYSAALGLSTLSSDLIDAVRGERLVDGRPVPFSITEIILGVCAIVQPIGEEKGLPLHAIFPTVDGRVGYPSAINRVHRAIRGVLGEGHRPRHSGQRARDAVRWFPPRLGRDAFLERRTRTGDLSDAAGGHGKRASGRNLSRARDAVLLSDRSSSSLLTVAGP